MFFEENDIIECLKCPKCGLKFNEPFLLPCGETICGYCLSFLIQNSIKNVRCFFCSKIHENPKDGFPKSKIALKLMQKNPKEIFRSKTVERLKQNLNEIKTLGDELNSDLNNAIDKIKEHCDSLRYKIQIDTENTISAITKSNQELNEQVNKYEKECIMTFENDESSINFFKANYTQLNSFHQKWFKYLTKAIINENEIIEALRESEDLKVTLNRDLSCLREVIFNGNIIKYESNINLSNNSLIGQLISKEGSTFYNLNKFEKVDLKLNSEVSVFHCLVSGCFFLSYPETSMTTVLAVYDQSGTLLRKKIEKFQFAFFSSCTYQNFIVFSSFSSETRDFICVIDENLDTRSKLDNMLVNGVIKMDANQTSIVCQVSDRNKEKYIAVYNWSLELLRTIKDLGDALINNDIKSLKLIDEFVVISANLVDEEIDLVLLLNQSEGKLINSIKIQKSDFKVDCNRRIVVYDKISAKIYFYKLDGQIDFEIYLVSFPDYLNLMAADRENLMFYDEKKSTIFRKKNNKIF